MEALPDEEFDEETFAIMSAKAKDGMLKRAAYDAALQLKKLRNSKEDLADLVVRIFIHFSLVFIEY